MPEDKPLRCDCGYQVTGNDEAELVAEIRSHARNVHGIAFSVEDALLIVLRSQLDMSSGSPTADTRASRVSFDEGGAP